MAYVHMYVLLIAILVATTISYKLTTYKLTMISYNDNDSIDSCCIVCSSSTTVYRVTYSYIAIGTYLRKSEVGSETIYDN